MSVNKHKALQEWVQQFLDNENLYFESADDYPGTRKIVPNYGDYINSQDVLGNKYKSYTFVFIGYENIDTGTSDVNTNNMKLFDDFNEWVELQKENKNFPDFGENCSEYEIVPLQNMANLSALYENGLAKYMLAVRINYVEY